VTPLATTGGATSAATTDTPPRADAYAVGRVRCGGWGLC
jgi:hypothetical protein